MQNEGDLTCDSYQERFRIRNKRKATAKRVRECKLRRKTQGCALDEDTRHVKLKNQLAEALENASGTRPMFIMKPSLIVGGGRGVFVSDEYRVAPKDTVIPYVGTIVTEEEGEEVVSEYKVKIREGVFLIANKFYTSGQPLGNFINRVVDKDTWKGRYYRRLRKLRPDLQDLSAKNADLIVIENVVYFRLIKNVACGQEILTTYGNQFRMIKPFVR